jgi:hypothetical protein
VLAASGSTRLPALVAMVSSDANGDADLATAAMSSHILAAR